MHSRSDEFVLFPWNENLETGIEIVDTQHKKIVEIINRLAESLVEASEDKIEEIFNELGNYASYHFETEEALWNEYLSQDAEFLAHQKTHAAFMPEVLEIQNERSNQPLSEVLEHIVKFLVRWLVLHIIHDDKRLALVIGNMKQGSALEDAKAAADKEIVESINELAGVVLSMYDSLSSRTLDLLRERAERERAEERLKSANRRLEELAVTDQLTRLWNRRHFDNVFGRELKRAKRNKSMLTFIMFDIDHFKNLNDCYGHAQGDVALQAVGKTLMEICRRPGDMPFRIGGEEFGVLVLDHSDHMGARFGEIIRSALENLKIENIGSSVGDHLTVSVGVVTCVPEHNDTVEALIKIADQRLYRAKSQGRNRIVSAD